MFFFFLLIRRPPSSTRTDATLSRHDALPICGLWPLLTHLAVRIVTLAGVAWLAWHYLDLGWQASALLALALLTPSTGFILDTLERLGLDEEERFWVTSKAIAGELLALAALFVIMQAGDPMQLGVSTLVMLGMLVGLPMLFISLDRKGTRRVGKECGVTVSSRWSPYQ